MNAEQRRSRELFLHEPLCPLRVFRVFVVNETFLQRNHPWSIEICNGIVYLLKK